MEEKKGRNRFLDLKDRISEIKESHEKIYDVCKKLNLVKKNFVTRPYNLCERIILPKGVCKKIKLIVENLKSNSEKIDFSLVIFEGEVDLEDVIFDQETFFEGTYFEKYANFKKASFKEKVSFYYTKFLGDAYFSTTIFENNADFSVTCFDERATFEDFIAMENLIFDYAIFKSEFYFSPKGKIKYLNLDDISIKENYFFKSTENNINDIKSGTRQTFRLLKHFALENHNKILANKLLQKEMVAYWKEITWSKNFGEKFILFFNFISNNCGLWWWLGIIFTLGTTFVFFSLYLWFDLKNIEQKFFIEYFKSLNPVYGLSSKVDNVKTVIFYLLEKIFLVLGIFRINQAFRKLNDKW